MLAVIGVLVVGFIYFWLYSRHRLVAEAPEEEFALTQGDQGVPPVASPAPDAPPPDPAPTDSPSWMRSSAAATSSAAKSRSR